MKQYTFSASERLKSRKQIGLVFNQGRHVNLPPLRTSWILEKGIGGEPLQAGVGASGKYFKKATDRNRIKRLLREAWRLQKSQLKNLLKAREMKLSVFLIYNGRELPEHQQVMEKVKEVIDRLTHIVNENPATDT